MNIKDVKNEFPDIPIYEQTYGFQMMDRPCLPHVVEQRLHGKVKHVGCYCFEWRYKQKGSE